MIGQSSPGGFKVSPLDILSIRSKAISVRNALGLPDGRIDQGRFLESLSGYGITIDVIDDLEDHLMPIGVEACCVPEEATIYLRESSYRAALTNEGRSLFTIFHELGHLLLVHRRAVNREPAQPISIKTYEDSEWQADQFAAESIMPLVTIKKIGLKTADQLVEYFGVSSPAANRRVNQLRKRNEL